jgi:hypothetical protein
MCYMYSRCEGRVHVAMRTSESELVEVRRLMKRMECPPLIENASIALYRDAERTRRVLSVILAGSPPLPRDRTSNVDNTYQSVPCLMSGKFAH